MLGMFDVTVFILSQWSQHSTLLLVFFCNDKYTCFFFSKQPSCLGFSIKNGPKVKQLAKQPPTLKMLLQKDLVDSE